MTHDEIERWHREHPYGARDEAYVDAVLAHVKRLWLAAPKQRLGQLLVNHGRATNGAINGDVFHVLDEAWVSR